MSRLTQTASEIKKLPVISVAVTMNRTCASSLLAINRENKNIRYGDYLVIIFPHSLLKVSKAIAGPIEKTPYSKTSLLG